MTGNPFARFGPGFPEAVLDSLATPVVVKAGDGRLIYANSAAGILAGRDRWQMIGRTDYDLVSREAADFLKSRDEEALRSHRPIEYEADSRNFYRTDKKYIIRKSVFTHNASKYIVSSLNDVTKLAETTATLEKRSAQLDFFFSYSPDIKCVTRDNRIEKVNPAFEKSLGYSASGIIGTHFLACLHPADWQAGAGSFAGERATGDCTGFVGRFRHRDGHYVTLEWTAGFGDGGVVYATARDVSQRLSEAEAMARRNNDLERLVASRTAELETEKVKLEHALAEERKLTRLQREFVSMASHEIRTPLAIVDATTRRIGRAIDRQETPEKVHESLARIRSNVIRMTELMESTLSAASIETGGVRMEMADCDLRAIVAEAVGNQQQICVTHDIALDPGDIPVQFHGDKRLLHQVFANLLSNAVKYSPGGKKVDVTGRVDGHCARIAVRDRGVGIPQGEIGQLFQRFFRATTSAGIAGTGLGLHLCKTIVERHGGDITVESGETGTCFTVALPLPEARSGPRAGREPGACTG